MGIRGVDDVGVDDAVGRQLVTVDQAVRALVAGAGAGREVEVAAVLEGLSARIAGARLEILARASAAIDDEDSGRAVVTVADQVHAGSRTTRRAARADVRLARQLDQEFGTIGQALRHGVVSEAQARAIVQGLRHLPSELTHEQLVRCQDDLVGYAAHYDPDELRRLAERMVEVIDPDHADAIVADRMEREARLAFQRRFVTVSPDYHGSMLIRGQLPVADGELLAAQLDALLPSAASYHMADEVPGRPARRADALVRLVQLAANSGDLPAQGADRPHVLVTMALGSLRDGLSQARLLGSGQPVAAREARRLACEANLIPMVLGSDSEPLEQGRARRLFAGGIRLGLVARDQGCAFPGCDAPPQTCDAHHILPWWQGGSTSLDNGILLCPYHHRLVEPDPRRPAQQQWQITLDNSGLPWFTPPPHIDVEQRPRQHHRYRLHQHQLPRPDNSPGPERAPVRTTSAPQPSRNWLPAEPP